MNKQTEFANGFNSWSETHFEIVAAITEQLLSDRAEKFRLSMSEKYHINQDTNGMYLLAERLTNEFEQKNAGREWDGEFFDEVEAFAKDRLE